MGAGMSAEEIQKLISGQTTESYLGDYGGHSPMLDLVNRLSQQLNQQTAESNLYRGGNGYGGSFESAAQRAARANGQTLGATPYGGAGGYGSQNPVMTKNAGGGGYNPGIPTVPATGSGPVQIPVDTPITNPYAPGTTPPRRPIPTGDPGPVIPDHAPPPRTGTPVPYPDPVVTPIPPGTDPGRRPIPTTTPAGTIPGHLPPPGGGQPGTVAAWSQEPQTISYRPPSSAAAPGLSSSSMSSGSPSSGMRVDTRDGLVALLDPNKRAAMLAEQKAADAAAGVDGGTPWYLDPQLVKMKIDLIDAGMNPSSDPQWAEVHNKLAEGASVAGITNHYKSLIKQSGGNALDAMHRSAGRLNKFTLEEINSGAAAKKVASNIGTGYDYKPPASQATATPSKAVVNQQAVTSPYASFSAPQPAQANTVAYVPPGDGVSIVGGGGAPGGGGNPGGGPPGPGGPGGGPNGPNVPEWTGPGPFFDPSKGKNWGKLTNPPKGAQAGDYWILPNGQLQTLGFSGTYHNFDWHPGQKQWYPNTQSLPAGAALHDVPVINAPSDWEDSYTPPADPKYPGGNMPTQVGATGVIGYDTEGNPIYNDNGMFEQGDNALGVGDVTPDAWSTSAPWRPEEPTGGVYGAFKDLASGNLTDYENQIGQNWRAMAENPVTAQDAETERLIGEYNRTPGKGIDEAYNAYNQMIGSDGYSAAEKGAMEGSAVRGVTAGYQRNMDDIRRQAARTGNANSAYAAMASQAGSYGGQLGEVNRQNQIKFADEAQRRKEAGAKGMTDVASLSNTKAQFGLGLQQAYANELQRRREAATKGMGDYATFGRGLQAQGISGMQGLLKDSESNKNNTYALISQLLGTKTGQYNSGSSNTNTRGWQVSASV